MEDAMVDARHEGGAYRRIEVITGRRRRQNWTRKDKARIVAESFQPDVNVSEVARRNGVSRGLLNVWRRQARDYSPVPTTGMFAAVRVDSDTGVHRETAVPVEKGQAMVGRIEIEIGGATIRVPRGVDRATLDAVIAVLRGPC